MFGKKKNIIETYKGNQTASQKLFLKDAAKKAKKGYTPLSQSFEPGSYGGLAFIIAILLCFVLIGILVFLYMLIVKPPGTLTVTYEYNEPVAEKSCPECAETIKEAAATCRFCRYKYPEEKALA